VSEAGPPGEFEYRVRARLPNGRYLRPVPFFTRRSCGVGDVVKLPVRRDGELWPGEGYTWRVAAVEEDGKLLVIEFERTAA
jgi:hypothetical protein